MLSEELPATPEVALAIMAIVDHEDADVADLAALVPRDPVLSARLLGLSNGLYFGAARKITDIRQAVMMLGLARVRELVTTLSVGAMLRLDDANPALLHTWRHSLMVGGAAKLLARGAGLRGEDAFIAGLLHDLGKLVLGMHYKDVYWEFVDRARETGQGIETLELAAWGVHHGTVGKWLLQHWGLSSTYAAPVAQHHDPLVPGREPTISSIVSVANRLIEAMDAEDGIDPVAFEECRPFVPAWLTPAAWARMYGELAADNDALVMLCDSQLRG